MSDDKPMWPRSQDKWPSRLAFWRDGYDHTPPEYCAGSHQFGVDVRYALKDLARLRALNAEMLEALKDAEDVASVLVSTVGRIRGRDPEDVDLHTHERGAMDDLETIVQLLRDVITKAEGTT